MWCKIETGLLTGLLRAEVHRRCATLSTQVSITQGWRVADWLLKGRCPARLRRIGTANGVPFHERPPDAMREDELSGGAGAGDGAPQPESVTRLWDGRSSGGGGGGGAGGSGGERPASASTRSRDDRDYSNGARTL